MYAILKYISDKTRYFFLDDGTVIFNEIPWTLWAEGSPNADISTNCNDK